VSSGLIIGHELTHTQWATTGAIDPQQTWTLEIMHIGFFFIGDVRLALS
jgi:hypothetical protein